MLLFLGFKTFIYRDMEYIKMNGGFMKKFCIFLILLVIALGTIAIVRINKKDNSELKEVSVAEVAHSVFFDFNFFSVVLHAHTCKRGCTH